MFILNIEIGHSYSVTVRTYIIYYIAIHIIPYTYNYNHIKRIL